jgi:hypothetical protein
MRVLYVLLIALMILASCGDPASPEAAIVSPTSVPVSSPVAQPSDTVQPAAEVDQDEGGLDNGEDPTPTETPTLPVPPDVGTIADPVGAVEVVMAYLREQYGESSPQADAIWRPDRDLPAEPVGGFSVGMTAESAPNWQVSATYEVDLSGDLRFRISVASEITVFRWEGEVDSAGSIVELAAPPGSQQAACWFGRVQEMPEDPSIDDCLVLPPEGAHALLVGLEGVDQKMEAAIAELRASGAAGHFFGTVMWDPTDCGGYRLVVSDLRPDGTGEGAGDPVPVQAWTGTLRGNPTSAQFDDYFLLSPYPLRLGVEAADPALGDQLAALRDSSAVLRLSGEVACPAVDYHGAQIRVHQVDVVMEAPTRPQEYDNWIAYQNATHHYTLWHPADWTLESGNLNESVTFLGPLVDSEYWPVVTIAHPSTPLHRPPAGSEVQTWFDEQGMHYDELTELGGFPALRIIQPGGPGAYGSDQFALIRGEQLYTVSFLHTGGREDWALYDKFLASFSFSP